MPGKAKLATNCVLELDGRWRSIRRFELCSLVLGGFLRLFQLCRSSLGFVHGLFMGFLRLLGFGSCLLLSFLTSLLGCIEE
jgi:hypothetical protein